jgi:caffeoyl-CoA O-methyltransferase
LDIVHPLAQSYAEKYSGKEDPLLQQIAAETYNNHAHPHMLSGHIQGLFLETISKICNARRILEIGTFTGYSAICLAKGLLKDGQLHTIELREDDARVSAENFRRANIEQKIILHTGNALDIIPTLNETWDLVFIDADKSNYKAYYDLVLPNVKPGGIILADNVLFHGQVLEQTITGKNAKAIQAFNEYLEQDVSVEKVLLTIRDGLLMIRKKA